VSGEASSTAVYTGQDLARDDMNMMDQTSPLIASSQGFLFFMIPFFSYQFELKT
jgi:hypothetical protein